MLAQYVPFTVTQLMLLAPWCVPFMHPQVDDNMRRAHERDAATKGKFFFRSNVAFARAPPQGWVPGGMYRPCADEAQNGHEEMTILEILEGKVRGDWIQDAKTLWSIVALLFVFVAHAID